MAEQPVAEGDDNHASDWAKWLSSEQEVGPRPHTTETSTFVEITRFPRKIEPRALTCMIVKGSKIVPKQTEICCKENEMEKVALVEFKSAIDAYQAVDRLRTSQLGRHWRMKFVENPKFADPEVEILNRWLR